MVMGSIGCVGTCLCPTGWRIWSLVTSTGPTPGNFTQRTFLICKWGDFLLMLPFRLVLLRISLFLYDIDAALSFLIFIASMTKLTSANKRLRILIVRERVNRQERATSFPIWKKSGAGFHLLFFFLFAAPPPRPPLAYGRVFVCRLQSIHKTGELEGVCVLLEWVRVHYAFERIEQLADWYIIPRKLTSLEHAPKRGWFSVLMNVFVL